MADTFDWDQFAHGDYFKLEAVGDEAFGNILDIKVHQFDDRVDDNGVMKPGQKCPMFTLEQSDGTTKDWTAGHVDAIKQLVALRPVVGQFLRAKIIRDLGPGKGKGKLYEVIVEAAKPVIPKAPVNDSDQPPF